MAALLTSVPLPLPMSLAAQLPSPVFRSSTCLRETEVSGIEMPLSVARPTTTSSPSSGYSLPALGPARQTSRAPATSTRLAATDEGRRGGRLGTLTPLLVGRRRAGLLGGRGIRVRPRPTWSGDGSAAIVLG